MYQQGWNFMAVYGHINEESTLLSISDNYEGGGER